MKQKRNFSSFSIDESFREVGIRKVLEWKFDYAPLELSDFFRERLRRLKKFDVSRSEDAKKLIIDAFFEEALQPFKGLKMWKSVPLNSDTLTGVVDYFVTEDIDILAEPYLCVVEAKKDDFEQGLAQCLVEMKAARWKNEQVEKLIDVFGVVSNGELWEFYQLTKDNKLYGSQSYIASDAEKVLGVLDYILRECEKNL